MAERTAIEWTQHTWNPWWGCQKVGPGCAGCYAEALDRRIGGKHWGPHAERRRTSSANWKQPLIWNRAAERDGVRRRVFCASMADFFDNTVDPTWRRDAWDVIRACTHLTWQLLTKRPGNIPGMLPDDWGRGWPHVWLGTTVVNQAEAERNIPQLQAVPAQLRFLSCEPMLGQLDLSGFLVGTEEHGVDLSRPIGSKVGCCTGWTPPIEWVIAGGESGPGARPMHAAWARSLRDQCQAAGVPFHFKQWGEFLPCWLDGKDRIRSPDGWAGHVNGHYDILLESAVLHRGQPQRLWRTFWASGDGILVRHVGKKAGGALLDGREWREIPDA